MRMINRDHLRIPALLIAVAVLLPLGVICAPDVRAAEIRVNPPSGGVAIFVLPVADPALGALAAETAAVLRDAFERCGRLVPVEEHRLRWAFGGARGGLGVDVYEDAARRLDVDLYMVVELRRLGESYRATLRSVPRREELAAMERTAGFESRIMTNIPQKLAAAAVILHRGVPVSAFVLDRLDDGSFILGAGQWHGIGRGTWPSSGYGTIEVLAGGRFESVARIAGGRPEVGSKIIIPVYPDVRALSRRYETRISENTIARYRAGATLLKGTDARKRYIEGACVVNPGGNACLPVYGAFLATGYLGFKDHRPDVSGLSVSGSLLALQFSLVPLGTGFSARFFPWERDGDKSREMQRMQYFLWAASPLTVSAAYLDQLAVQFSRSGTLPPFFEDRNAFAALCSAVVPGGGQFYKARRRAGWGFFVSEISLGAATAYYFGKKTTGGALLGVLGAVKLADIAAAFFMRTGYDTYNRETGADDVAPVPFLGVRQSPDGGRIVMLGVSQRH